MTILNLLLPIRRECIHIQWRWLAVVALQRDCMLCTSILASAAAHADGRVHRSNIALANKDEKNNRTARREPARKELKRRHVLTLKRRGKILNNYSQTMRRKDMRREQGKISEKRGKLSKITQEKKEEKGVRKQKKVTRVRLSSRKEGNGNEVVKEQQT